MKTKSENYLEVLRESYEIIKEMIDKRPVEARTKVESDFLAAYEYNLLELQILEAKTGGAGLPQLRETLKKLTAALPSREPYRERREAFRKRREARRQRNRGINDPDAMQAAELAANAIDTWETFALNRLESLGWSVEVSNSRVGPPRIEWRNGEAVHSEPDLPAARLLLHAVEARAAIQQEQSAMAFLKGVNVSRCILENGGASNLLRTALAALNRERSKKPRAKPLLGTRAIAVAWEKGHRDTASIRDFFNEWRGKFKDDEWGGLSLDAADDFAGWELIDEGAKAGKDGEKPTKDIKDASLPSMVSRFKKDRLRPS